MGWLPRILAQQLPDPPPRDPSNPLWWGQAPQMAVSGVRVDGETALRIGAVYAAVSVISSAIAGVPFILYRRRADRGKDRALNHPLYTKLHDAPNEAQTSFEWREYLTACALLRGNGYAEILPGLTGFADQLDVPFHPDCVTVNVDPDRRRIVSYDVTLANGRTRTIRPDQMFHLRGLTKDGLVGMSVISYARDSLGLALAAESYGARFFSQDATPKGVLTHPGSFKENSPAPARIKAEWQLMQSGLNNAHSIAVLEEGMEYQAIGINHEDAQFLQTREFSIREIARWFQIQPHMIQDLANATFTNIEHQGQEFVTYTLNRWAKRWEQTVKRQLINDPALFAEFLFDDLLRGDTLSRVQSYHLARVDGWLSPDDIREKENLNPRPDGKGDSYDPPVSARETLQEKGTPGSTLPGAELDDLDILARSNGHAR